MYEVRLSNGKAFGASPTDSLLQAAQKANVLLPHSCMVGRCGACKCQILSGSTTLNQLESGLSEQEKSNGWILSCVRAAESDLVIDASDLSGVHIPPAKTIPAKIRSLQKVSDDVIQVTVRLPPKLSLPFLAGQYVELIIPGNIRRSYSIASDRLEDTSLDFHIRRVPGGASSDYWFNRASTNDLLYVRGPLGTFFLREAADRNLVFLATGTGIAPIKSMLYELSALREVWRPKSTTVLWGNRHESDIYMNVSDEFPGISYVPVLSRPQPGWTGARGYVQDILLGTQLDITDCVVYACGSQHMIYSSSKALFAAGLTLRNFHSDAFVCSAPNSSD